MQAFRNNFFNERLIFSKSVNLNCAQPTSALTYLLTYQWCCSERLFFVYCISIFESWQACFYSWKQNATISIMCVLRALRLHDRDDRDEIYLCLLRIKFWVLIYCETDLHTAITDAVYCVKFVACDRRLANKLRKGLDKALHKSYNTTPAEEGKGSSLLFAAWALNHMFIISLYEVDHI